MYPRLPMPQKLARFALVVTLFFAVSAIAGAAYQKEKPEKPPKGPREKPSIYIIVQLNEDFQVMRKEELKEFRKSQTEQFKAAEKGYKQAQKDAKKAKEKFDQPKPVRPIIKPIAGEYTNKEKAEEQANKLREEVEKAKSKAKK
jgi:hypothetical protein